MLTVSIHWQIFLSASNSVECHRRYIDQYRQEKLSTRPFEQYLANNGWVFLRNANVLCERRKKRRISSCLKLSISSHSFAKWKLKIAKSKKGAALPISVKRFDNNINQTCDIKLDYKCTTPNRRKKKLTNKDLIDSTNWSGENGLLTKILQNFQFI